MTVGYTRDIVITIRMYNANDGKMGVVAVRKKENFR